jgi:hypothetical protein
MSVIIKILQPVEVIMEGDKTKAGKEKSVKPMKLVENQRLKLSMIQKDMFDPEVYHFCKNNLWFSLKSDWFEII